MPAMADVAARHAGEKRLSLAMLGRQLRDELGHFPKKKPIVTPFWTEHGRAMLSRFPPPAGFVEPCLLMRWFPLLIGAAQGLAAFLLIAWLLR
jgi:hypothetical protein